MQRFLYAVIKSSVGLVYDKLNRLHFSRFCNIFSLNFVYFFMAELILIFQNLKEVDI